LAVYATDREEQKSGFTISKDDMFLNWAQPCSPT